MRKQDIEVGGEYAVSLRPSVQLTSPRSYMGMLAHARVIAKDHQYEAQSWGYDRSVAESRKGYLVELVEPFDFKQRHGLGVSAAGDQHVVSSGREIVQAWDEYAAALVEHEQAMAEAKAAQEASEDALDRIETRLRAVGIDADDWTPRREGGFSGRYTGVTLTLAALDLLLGFVLQPSDGARRAER